ncbi:MAG: hypothetical protein KatS3mg104_1644 [Phycisphaerae bacterium]|nr:MAG: hypothetical protein KatS3mg104_1644 [Phycisphaerae bacterium]
MTTSYRHLVGNIREFCKKADQNHFPQLTDWAARYATLCDNINVRLIRCSDLLRRGLRSEAIFEAEKTPALLDMVSVADFPEFPLWESICAMHQLPQPTRVSIELAAELNEAYSAYRKIAQVLQLHRIAAIALAPIRDRIKILKELIKIDPMTVFWKQDLVELEKVRILQLRSELAEAAKTTNFLRIEAIEQEIQTTQWSVTFPEDLKQTVQKIVDDYRKHKAIESLKQLLPDLSDAYSAMMFDETSVLMDQWFAIVSANNLTVPHDLEEAVGPIQSWVEEERKKRNAWRQFESDCEYLQNALKDSSMESEKLREMMYSLRNTGFPIPEELERNYHNVIHQHELTILRRKRRNILMAGLAAVAVIALVAFVGKYIYDRQEANRLARQITELTVTEKLPEALAVLEMAKSLGYQDMPEIVTAAKQLTDANEKELKRTQQFAEEIKRITAEIESKNTKVDFSKVNSLAKTNDEKLNLLKLKEVHSDLLLAKQKAEIEKANQVITTLNKLVTSAEGSFAEDDLEAADRSSAEAQRLLLDLNEASLPPEFGVNINLLKDRIDSVHTKIQRRKRYSQTIQDLVDATQTASQFAEQLIKSGKTIDDEARAIVWAETAKLYPHWQTVEQFSDICTRIATSIESRQRNPMALIQARQDLSNWIVRNSRGVLQSQAKVVFEYINKIDSIANPSSSLRRSFVRILQSNPMSRWLQLKTKEGTYYVANSDDIIPIRINDKVISLRVNYIEAETLDSNQPLKKEMTLDTARIIAGKDSFGEKSEQSILANSLIQEINQTSLDNWHTFYPRLARKILSADSVDPIIRTILLQLLIESHVTSQVLPVSSDLRMLLTKISEHNLTNVAWMNPTNTNAAEKRKICIELLKEAKNLPQIFTESQDSWFLNYMQNSIRVIKRGVLFTNRAGSSVRLKNTVENGDIYTVVVDTNGTPVWLELGKIIKGTPQITNNSSLLTDGCMVFVTHPMNHAEDQIRSPE